MRRGEVWWTEGAEGKRRPALVMTRSEAISVLRSVVVVPAARTVRGISTEVAADREDGLPQACAFTFDNLTLLHKSQLIERICTLGLHLMQRSCAAVAAAFDC